MTTDKWISFDCYGTLIDWRSGLLAGLERVAPGYGSRMLGLHRRIEGEIEAGPYQPYRAVLAQSLTRMAGEVGAPLQPADHDALAESLPTWPMYADTALGLEGLKRDGWKLAILSNIDDDLMTRTLANFPVAIDHVVTAENVRSYKPRPAHFEGLLSQTGLDPQRWVHAAVNLEYDLYPAARFGARTVWVNREHEPATDFALLDMVDTVGELPAAVSAVFSDSHDSGAK